MQNLRVAQVCENCKHSMFKTKNHLFSGGKKMTGYCLLNVDTEEPSNSANSGVLYDYVVKHGEMMSLDEYLEYAAAKLYYMEESSRMNYYNTFKKNFEWWQENRSKLIFIHRTTVCDQWQPGRKNNIAASIANGKRKPEWMK